MDVDSKCLRDAILEVRGQGLMIGFDLLPGDPKTATETVNRFMYTCRGRGVHLTYGYGDVNFRIMPPLIHRSFRRMPASRRMLVRAASSYCATSRLSNPGKKNIGPG